MRTLQLRKKRPKRRVSAKGREDRVVATAANECWSMDFLSDGDRGKGGRGCVDRIVRLASCRFALTLWARCCCRFLPVISAMHSELRAAIMRHAVSDRGVRRGKNLGGHGGTAGRAPTQRLRRSTSPLGARPRPSRVGLGKADQRVYFWSERIMKRVLPVDDVCGNGAAVFHPNAPNPAPPVSGPGIGPALKP